jgi:Protein of unknown function (DUF2785)
MDKADWQAIIDDDYQLPEEAELIPLTDELLDYLGSPDADLRDNIANAILSRWITIHNYHTPQQLQQMTQWLTQQLSKDIGSRDSDSVFLRSYSALILSLVMYRNSRESFFSEVEVNLVLHAAKDYLLNEQDRRAYIGGKGWANAMANTCDLLRFVVYADSLSPADLQVVMNTVGAKVMQATEEAFTHDEEDRLAKIILTIMSRDELDTFDYVDWVKRFVEWKSDNIRNDVYNATYNATYQNIKRLLRALFTQMTLAPRIPIAVREFEGELLGVMREFTV